MGGEAISTDLRVPRPGDHSLQILSPNLVELVLINTKQPDPGRLDSWDWVTEQRSFAPPDMSSVRVMVDGQRATITGVGFKRRPLYAPLITWDLRIANHLYLQLATQIAPGQSVQVLNNGTLWPTNKLFASVANPLRYNPAIHVNQEGYLPDFPKKGMVGYYIGSLGEMPISATTFSVVDAKTGAAAFQGTLTPRPDVGFTYLPTPYQNVLEADFTGLRTVGEYRLVVPGLGASLPFRIDDAVAMNLARTYALGMFHQRSGYDVAMPFTRFTHSADHIAPAVVPLTNASPYVFTWSTIASYANETNKDNPPQIAPRLTTPAAQLYPFVNPGPVDVSGGHFEAANYSKPAWNNAQIIHFLMFAVDALPGVGVLDNLGIPESGDGISDVLQEAKWEADCLVKMQDTDGGFYYMIHPRDREYEYDVLPENGDLQVVWPKNTASTAASVAALVQCASSPRLKQAYPQAANKYMASAQLGWRFLTNAIATHGMEGSYQRIMHFDDAFTHNDDLVWAACELYVATGDPEYRARLEALLPDPTSAEINRWGWWRMYASYGNAIRSYATAVKSGRLQASQIDAAYLGKCVSTITNCGNDYLRWSRETAYGSSIPDATKRVRDAGWYYSTEQAFNLVVAQEFNPSADYVDAILANINYETGCNPVNISYTTGLGLKRQREVVDQYSINDRRVLPKIGVPVSNIQGGFVNTWTYSYEPAVLVFPSDGAEVSPYPLFDRWCDFWNVTTEASTPNTTRSLAVAVWLAAKTGLASQAWRSTNATIVAPTGTTPLGRPVNLSLQVADSNLAGARITWEARDQEPTFGGLNYSFTPTRNEGPHWIEAEVHWPDGRRAFAISSVNVGGSVSTDPPILSAASFVDGGFSFSLAGVPQATYVIQASSNLSTWTPIATNAVAASGFLRVNDPAAGASVRYYRALKLP